MFVIVEETQSVKLWKTKKFGRVKAAFIVRTMKESNLRLSLSPWRTNGHRCSNYRFERKRRPAQILLPRVLTVLSLSLRGDYAESNKRGGGGSLLCMCVLRARESRQERLRREEGEEEEGEPVRKPSRNLANTWLKHETSCTE